MSKDETPFRIFFFNKPSPRFRFGPTFRLLTADFLLSSCPRTRPRPCPSYRSNFLQRTNTRNEKREENNYARGRKSIVTFRLGYLDRFTDLSFPNEERINNNRTRGKDSLRKAVSFFFTCSISIVLSIVFLRAKYFFEFARRLKTNKKREKHFVRVEGEGGIRCLPDRNKREMFFFSFFNGNFSPEYRVQSIRVYLYFIYTRENEY